MPEFTTACNVVSAWSSRLLLGVLCAPLAAQQLPAMLEAALGGDGAAAKQLVKTRWGKRLVLGSVLERTWPRSGPGDAMQAFGASDVWAVTQLAAVVIDLTNPHRKDAAAALLRLGSVATTARATLEAAAGKDRSGLCREVIRALTDGRLASSAESKAIAVDRGTPRARLLVEALGSGPKSWSAACTLFDRGGADRLKLGEVLLRRVLNGTPLQRRRAKRLLVALRCAAHCEAIADAGVLRLLPEDALIHEAPTVALRGAPFLLDKAQQFLARHRSPTVRSIALLAYAMPQSRKPIQHSMPFGLPQAIASVNRSGDAAAKARVALVREILAARASHFASKDLPAILRALEGSTESMGFRAACMQIHGLGPAAAPALDKLIAHYKTAGSGTRSFIVRAFQGIGRLASERLIAAAGPKEGPLRDVARRILQNAEPFDAAVAATMLRGIAPDTKPKAIQAAFNLSQSRVRVFVALRDDKELRPALVRALVASQHYLYWRNELPEFREVLLSYFATADDTAKIECATVIGLLGPAGCRVLVAATRHENPQLRVAAFRAIGQHGDESTIDSALSGLDDEVAAVQRAAMSTLFYVAFRKGIKAKADRVRDRLLVKYADLRAQQKSTALRVLMKVAPQDARVTALIERELASDDEALRAEARVQAYFASATRKRIAKRAGEDLRAESAAVRRQALTLVWRVGPPAVEHLDRVIELLDDRDQDVVSLALRALRTLGPEAKKALPRIRRFVEENDPRHFGRATLAIRRLSKD